MSKRKRNRRVRLVRSLLRVMPALPHAVVAGSPDDEGNSVEVLRALGQHMRVFWLVSEPPESLWWLVQDAPGADAVRCLPRQSVRAYLAYLTARYVFFTHGLYGSPQPPVRKTFVNLWHGDGPKQRKRFANIRSTHIVAGTRLWGERRPQIFDLPEGSVLITGNPRVDQFARPADASTLAALSLPPDRPLVLWLPTYRRTEYRGRRLGPVRNWSDAHELSGSAETRQFAADLVEAARALGVTVAIKPHPLDGDTYAGLGLPVINGRDLSEARTTLYQLLAATCGLITDYSSVWTDYLCLDRPIGFFCPDLDAYQAARGLNVTCYRDLLPGPLLESQESVKAFLGECLDESRSGRVRRQQIATRIGAQRELGASARLLTALGLGTPAHGAQ